MELSPSFEQFFGKLKKVVKKVAKKTQNWWQAVMDTKRKGYNTTIRLWPLGKPGKTS